MRVMITLIGYVVVRDGMMEEALKLVKEMVLKVRETEPDNIDYTAYTSKTEGNENKIYFYESFENESALQLHGANLAQQFGERMGPIFDMSKNTMTKCERII